jgi:glycosyltransferase involved in cell wall biosynthesis
MANALHICYFGVREPLVQTQVLPYLHELAGAGHRISLVTFEPKAEAQRLRAGAEVEVRAELARQGIDWHWLRYHKRPSAIATAWDIVRGTKFVLSFVRRHKINLLHARVHVPALIAVLARKLSRRKPKILFDIRGFVPDEYVDAGIWPEGGWLYRIAKRIERWLLRESDGFVVLTEKARGLLFPGSRPAGEDRAGRPVEVIPCCVDLTARFGSSGEEARRKARKEQGLEDRYVIAHLGALGGLYLTEKIVEFMATVREERGDVFAMFLAQSGTERLSGLLEKSGFSQRDRLIARVAAAEVGRYLITADVGLSIVKATYATASRSPTKIPEYLACGVPLIANSGVGDVDALIEETGVGVLLSALDPDSYRAGFRRLQELGDLSERCRAVARERFDLQQVGKPKYLSVYERTLGT